MVGRRKVARYGRASAQNVLGRKGQSKRECVRGMGVAVCVNVCICVCVCVGGADASAGVPLREEACGRASKSGCEQIGAGRLTRRSAVELNSCASKSLQQIETAVCVRAEKNLNEPLHRHSLAPSRFVALRLDLGVHEASAFRLLTTW
eukprot:6209557-Pleurochrysis_carterae.AAC.1